MEAVKYVEGHPNVIEPGKPPSSAATRKDVAMENAVHDSARKAGSEIKLGTETHGIAAYGKGEMAGFRFCSEPYCSLVGEKVGAILNGLPKNYDKAMVSDLRHLYLRIKGVERALKDGQIIEEMANRFSHQLAKELESYAERDAAIGSLLRRTTEDLRAKRDQIRGELEAKPPSLPAKRPLQPAGPGTAGTRYGRTYRIDGDPAAIARSQRGYQVYEYRNKADELLYVGKSGGAGGETPISWPDRLKEEHILTEWVGEVRSVSVTSELSEQDAFALEEALIPEAKYNKKLGEHSSRFPQGGTSAGAAVAGKHGSRARFSLDVMF
jgi:hypothetical protein